ncbi:MAG: hypothetical protein EZS28_043996 [Streblomastix strix]|uniref:Uncharacterized protein n=1 Tax=Streblomastix strix TaxID=222440 RepID=A0A5J4TQG4_9EUKA|nr:MAG: hypothetical protein EZS28_043996 [Streblomastix strix]
MQNSKYQELQLKIFEVRKKINIINVELNRQTHYRGNYLLNTDLQLLEYSVNVDFALNVESGTVWVYDNRGNNSGDIDPDQVTPASDANPLVDSGTGVVGTSTGYSRGDNQHPLQVSTMLPSKDISVGTIGSASSYARSDHQHPIQTVDTIPVSDINSGIKLCIIRTYLKRNLGFLNLKS